MLRGGEMLLTSQIANLPNSRGASMSTHEAGIFIVNIGWKGAGVFHPDGTITDLVEMGTWSELG